MEDGLILIFLTRYLIFTLGDSVPSNAVLSLGLGRPAAEAGHLDAALGAGQAGEADPLLGLARAPRQQRGQAGRQPRARGQGHRPLHTPGCLPQHRELTFIINFKLLVNYIMNTIT